MTLDSSTTSNRSPTSTRNEAPAAVKTGPSPASSVSSLHAAASNDRTHKTHSQTTLRSLMRSTLRSLIAGSSRAKVRFTRVRWLSPASSGHFCPKPGPGRSVVAHARTLGADLVVRPWPRPTRCGIGEVGTPDFPVGDLVKEVIAMTRRTNFPAQRPIGLRCL